MTHAVITVENLGKYYKLGRTPERYQSFRDTLTRQLRQMRRSLEKRRRSHPSLDDGFWALDDISFSVQQGDRLGIIGHNGAGKSTLLKILSRITEPTRGRIGIRGRIASLLEVGTGFHPELSGRENIFLNGAILGMSKLEIRRKFDEIVAFAEVEKFLDTPVKRYSSGMYVRLAFAVAAHLEPEILVVDEVLAVGDTAFQKKCLGKMEEVGKEGRTVLFVSHNMGVIQALCNRGIVLKKGQVILDDTAQKAVSTYLSNLETIFTSDLGQRQDRKGAGRVKLQKIEAYTADEYRSATLATGRPVRFIFSLDRPMPGVSCIFTLYDQYGNAIVNFNSSIHSHADQVTDGLDKEIICECDALTLMPGRYRMNAALFQAQELQDHIESAAIVDVRDGEIQGRPVLSGIQPGSLVIPHRWLLPA